jgi:hypothetical protein
VAREPDNRPRTAVLLGAVALLLLGAGTLTAALLETETYDCLYGRQRSIIWFPGLLAPGPLIGIGVGVLTWTAPGRTIRLAGAIALVVAVALVVGIMGFVLLVAADLARCGP